MSGMVIDASTELIGVMGWPVKHSLSPAMHNAALRQLGLNWCYVALPVHPAAVAVAINGLAVLHFRGCNVTVPHKRAVMQALDEIDPAAKALGAVNTLAFIQSESTGESNHVRIVGYNTDVPGFLGDVRTHGFDPCGRRVVIVGAGGAARGVAYACLSAQAERVVVLNRTSSRAEHLLADFADSRLVAGSLTPDALVEEARRADLLVNATTVGMWPKTSGMVWPEKVKIPDHLVVYDLVYNPLETHLLKKARQDGAVPVDGLGMLARQGALALDLWTEQALDVDEVTALMREVCLRAFKHS